MNLEKIIPNQKTALMLAKKQVPQLVCDAVNLEGIHFTLPEVQTLLDGVSVGGHPISDQTITLNQAAAWKLLFSMVESNTFSVTKETACALHAVAAKEEALLSGEFRNGKVTIAGTDFIPPPPDQLLTCWKKMVDDAEKITSIFDRAIFIFLQMARNQFFFDVNKRTGRFMMNGLLLSQGYPVINLPAKKQLEFNTLMLNFYVSNNVSSMTTFMKSCLEEKIIEIMSVN